jgi:hypothetical protein
MARYTQSQGKGVSGLGVLKGGVWVFLEEGGGALVEGVYSYLPFGYARCTSKLKTNLFARVVWACLCRVS